MTSIVHKNYIPKKNQQATENRTDDGLDTSCNSSQSWGRSRARPGYQDGTPAQVETLTEEQHRSLKWIGNRRTANRMCRPTRFTYTREEKLFAIQYCREARSLNIETMTWFPITMEVAARKHLVDEIMLRRWMKDEDKIVAMPTGSKRADKRPRVQTETVSSDEVLFENESSPTNGKFSYYLQLTPRQLRDTLNLAASDHRFHTFQHPIPFVGIEGGRLGKLYTFQDAYNFLNYRNAFSHPGRPLPPPVTVSSLTSSERPSLNIHTKNTYTRRTGESKSPTLKVVDVNKQLYNLAPEFDIRAPIGGNKGSHELVRAFYDEVKYCVALICQSIATSSSMVNSALPVRIELDYDYPYPGAPTQWAILFSFGDEELLLPLALSLWGPQTMNASKPNILYLQGWTIDPGIRTTPRESKIKEHSTVLYVTDVEPLFLRAEDRWRPRRYTSTWALHTTPIHANYACSGFYSTIHGRYMDIELLVNSIFQLGSRVIFMKDATRKPFELLRLRGFSLHRPTSRPYDHLYSLTEKLIKGVRPQALEALYSDEVEHFTPTQVAKGEEDISMLQSRGLGRGTAGTHGVTCSIAELEDTVNVTDIDEVGEDTLYHNNGPMKKRRLNQCSAMQRVVLKNYMLELYSGYCKHHSSRILQYVSSLKSTGVELPMPQWELNLTNDAATDVKNLSDSYHKNRQKTWVIDFEYITLSGGMSPIPLQFAIRQLDGKLLLAENVHYDLSLEGFLAKLATWEPVDRHAQVLFTRCYSDIMTNGLRPEEIRDKIIHDLNYSAERFSIILWYSQQDMQCFQRLLLGSRELIVPKESRHLCSTFQNIDVGRLLKKLLPRTWPSMSLSVVHGSLLTSHGRSGDHRDYHTAAYDTKAVTDIVKEIETLIK
ncbi:hypothetical protein BDV26DRAFT_301652 [Aspergillus bertholletiae]|uniref:Uncharacterized protein n=1 Tax=Aspergillus bertholletiae TaxID=1226010 RepID=A0A5N7BNV8_9EURO|nr:hypothetical protein BDV26DRAFT_301652 [Aspergillus bertholletiae]